MLKQKLHNYKVNKFIHKQLLNNANVTICKTNNIYIGIIIVVF
jgi:hypothetical protein